MLTMGTCFDRWHGDLKPANILRVHGKFKLADFGFARFEKHRPERRATQLLGGTRTYGEPLSCPYFELERRMLSAGTGAPESDPQNSEAGPALQLQTIDTWSFGCVLSAVATWLVLGPQAYHDYDRVRQRAISKLRGRRIKGDHVNVPGDDDAFHDGRAVLPAVTDWHKYLRNSAKRADTITHLVLDLVDKEMLVHDPEKRLTSEDVCRRLGHILRDARSDYEIAVRDPWNKLTLTEDSPEILQALLELDEQAPSVSEPQGKVRGGVSMPSTSSEVKDFNPVPASHRVGKSELWEKILIGKTANRTPVLKDLNSRPPTSEGRPNPPAVPDEGKGTALPKIATRLSTTPDVYQSPNSYTDISTPSLEAPYPERQKSPEEGSWHGYPIIEPTPTTAEYGSVPSGSGAIKISAGPVPAADGGYLAMRHPLDDPGPRLSEMPPGVAPRVPSGQVSSARMPASGHPVAVESSSSGVQSPDSALPNHPRVVISTETAIYEEYRHQQQLRQGQNPIWRRIGGGPPADRQLKKFITDRDIVRDTLCTRCKSTKTYNADRPSDLHHRQRRYYEAALEICRDNAPGSRDEGRPPR